MTQEDRELLLKDLCARLPYGVKCKVNYIINNETTYGEDVESECIDTIKRISFDTYSVYTEWLGYESDIEDIKPYLRPMSSMTKEERKELSKRYNWRINGVIQIRHHSDSYWDDDTECSTEDYLWLFDWLNSHHFDYRGLIPKGLAIEVTEENNPYKEQL